jgi:predicted transcriptional regulator
MSAKKQGLTTESTPSTAASNVELFLRTVRGEPETKKAANPTDVILGLLRSGPQSFPSLMKESGMTFDELDEALNRLEKRGVITAEGEGDARRYRLTAAGKALPAD